MMNRLLLSTTVLLASTGLASAEVTMRGFAEMGIIGGNNGVEDQFFTDIDVTFTLSGTTDSGFAFGANIDLDESDGAGARGNSLAFDGDRQGGETLFISGDFGTLTMGDTDGVFDWALQEVGIGGTINDSNTTHAGYSGNGEFDGVYDGQILRYDRSMGDFAFGASFQIDDTGVRDLSWGIGVRYNLEFNEIKVGLGAAFLTAEPTLGTTSDNWGFSIDTRFPNGLRAIVNYSDRDGFRGIDDHFAFGVGYTKGPWTFAGNYGSFGLVGGGEDEGYALNVAYNLGGGATLQAGYSTDDDAAGVDDDRYDVGIAISF